MKKREFEAVEFEKDFRKGRRRVPARFVSESYLSGYCKGLADAADLLSRLGNQGAATLILAIGSAEVDVCGMRHDLGD